MGRHSHDHRAATQDVRTGDAPDHRGPADTQEDCEYWEEAPRPTPLWRTRIVTSAVLLLAVVAGTWWAVGWLTSPAGPGGAAVPGAASVQAPSPGTATASESARGVASPPPSGTAARDTAASDTVTIHVAGEVNQPGLFDVPVGSRVADAVQAAGGPTEDAELDLMNLAAPVVDATQILVPGTGDAVTEAPVEGGEPGTGPADSRPGSAAGASATVDLNVADTAALEQLPGIGPALAGRIIEHRDQVGPFGSMEDLDAVSGIGPALMERLDGLVSW